MTYTLPIYNRPLGNDQFEPYEITSEAYSQALVDGELLDVCDRALNRAAQIEVNKLQTNETLTYSQLPSVAFVQLLAAKIMANNGIRNEIANRLRQVIANNGFLHLTTEEVVIQNEPVTVSRVFGSYSNGTPSSPRKIKVDDILPVIELVIQNQLFMQNLKESGIV